MDERQIKAIEAVLAKGARIELIPVKIIHVKREELKQNIAPASKR